VAQSTEPRHGPDTSARRGEAIRTIQAALSDTEELLDPRLIAAGSRSGTRQGRRGVNEDVAATAHAYRSATAPNGRRSSSSAQARAQAEALVRARAAQGGRAGLTRAEAKRRNKRRGLFAEFVHRYGWRAYAIPVLLVVTVVALFGSNADVRKAVLRPVTSSAPAGKAPSQAPASAQLKVDKPQPGSVDQLLASYALPPGPAYSEQGNGAFIVQPGSAPGVGSGKVWKYDIDVEGGITGVDTADFANVVFTTLLDTRSWIGGGNAALQRVATAAQADFHVTLTSSMTVRTLCGYTIQVETSCYDAAHKRVVLNVARWVRGDLAYVGDLQTYRIYMVNHEVGHAIGHMHSHQCLANGLAPVMMQQTLGLKSENGKICQANPWPYPANATDAPGAESADTPANSPIQIPGS